MKCVTRTVHRQDRDLDQDSTYLSGIDKGEKIIIIFHKHLQVREKSVNLPTTHRPPHIQNLMLRNKNSIPHRPTAAPKPIHPTIQSVDQVCHFPTLPLSHVIGPKDSLDAYGVHVRDTSIARAGVVDCFARDCLSCGFGSCGLAWRAVAELVVQGAGGAEGADAGGGRRQGGRFVRIGFRCGIRYGFRYGFLYGFGGNDRCCVAGCIGLCFLLNELEFALAYSSDV